jgi:mevalonate kinase
MEAEIHAKLTGAGGGGCVLCLPKDPDFKTYKQDLFKVFQEKGYTVYEVKQEQEGVRVDSF